MELPRVCVPWGCSRQGRSRLGGQWGKQRLPRLLGWVEGRLRFAVCVGR